MKKIFLPLLLAVSLILSMTGCGKSESASGKATGGDAVDLAGDGNSVDLAGILEGGDSADLTGMPEGNGSEGNRQTVDEDFVIVKMPTISYEDFGNGFYDTYLLVSMEKKEAGPEISYDEDGLLAGVKGNYESGSGEISESWLTIEYVKEDSLVAGCEINADMYSFFVYEFGFDEEMAKELNDELMGKMPIRLVFDEPAEVPEAVMERTIAKLGEGAESEADYAFVEAFYSFYDMYLARLYSGDTEDAGDIGYTVELGHGAQGEFKGRMNGTDLAVNYLDGGDLTGETKISNDPGWSIDMSVSHDDVICQIEMEQDSDGNLTLVHLYNDYASYDYVYTYDSAGRMVRYDHYEYPRGQNREAVGASWYTEYSYDSEGRLTRKQSVSNQDNGVNSATEYYYDDMGRVAVRKDTTQFFGSDAMTMQQTYDSVTQSYEYDESGKVGCVTVTVDWAQTMIQSEPVEPTTVLYIPAQ